LATSEESRENLAQDIVGMKVDKIVAQANLHSVKIADNLLSELVHVRLKK
jgi:hypothetical protein